MRKNSLLFISLIFFFTFSCIHVIYAQKESIASHDRIYLKDGKKLLGSIVNRTENNEYNFVTVEGKTMVIPAEKVERIEKIKMEKITNPITKPLLPKAYGVVEAGLLAGFKDIDTEGGNFDNSGIFPGINASANLMVTPQTSMGAGIGYQTYGEGSMLPLILDFRGYLGRMPVLPFAVVNLGYSFGWANDKDIDNWGGVFINPNLGVAWRLPGTGTLFIRAGYELQRIVVKGVAEKLNAQFLTVKIGYGF